MLRNLLILWMLAAAPLLQARTLMHCEMMGEVAPEECCCHGDSAEVAVSEPDDDCCEVTVVTVDLPEAVLAPAGTDDGLGAFPATGPPPTTFLPPAPAAQLAHARSPFHAPPGPAASPVWLTTRRLRI